MKKLFCWILFCEVANGYMMSILGGFGCKVVVDVFVVGFFVLMMIVSVCFSV